MTTEKVGDRIRWGDPGDPEDETGSGTVYTIVNLNPLTVVGPLGIEHDLSLTHRSNTLQELLHYYPFVKLELNEFERLVRDTLGETQ